MKKLVISSFISLIIVSGTSQAESVQKIMEKIEKAINIHSMYSTVLDNAINSCTEQYKDKHNIYADSKEIDKMFAICNPIAENAGIATIGTTLEQNDKEAESLVDQLCLIHKKTKSTKIKDFFSKIRGEVMNHCLYDILE